MNRIERIFDNFAGVKFHIWSEFDDNTITFIRSWIRTNAEVTEAREIFIGDGASGTVEVDAAVDRAGVCKGGERQAAIRHGADAADILFAIMV